MKYRLLALAVAILATVAIVVATASAAPAGKVFVCKYVGTPGTSERLQTGQNPIDVSINAIKDYQGVGSYFNDKQGRSFVLAEDVGQADPDVSECPAPEGPPVCTEDCGPPPCTTDCGPPPCEVDCGPVTPPVTPPVVKHPHHVHVPKSPSAKQYIQDVTHGADTGGG